MAKTTEEMLKIHDREIAKLEQDNTLFYYLISYSHMDIRMPSHDHSKPHEDRNHCNVVYARTCSGNFVWDRYVRAYRISHANHMVSSMSEEEIIVLIKKNLSISISSEDGAIRVKLFWDGEFISDDFDYFSPSDGDQGGPQAC